MDSLPAKAVAVEDINRELADAAAEAAEATPTDPVIELPPATIDLPYEYQALVKDYESLLHRYSKLPGTPAFIIEHSREILKNAQGVVAIIKGGSDEQGSSGRAVSQTQTGRLGR